MSYFTSRIALIVCLTFFVFTGSLFARQSAGQTESFNWSQYQDKLKNKIRKHWSSPYSPQTTSVQLKWKIHSNGSISHLEIAKASKNPKMNEAALSAVQAAAPFDSLPKGSKDIDIEYAFESNHDNLRLSADEAVAKYGPDARKRLSEEFQKTHLKYPPSKATLLCLKRSKILYLLVKDQANQWTLISSYPVVSASGREGPKLKQGDLQVPEGFYTINKLNAWTHLALCINYPNEFDRANAKNDKRKNLGSNIEIHNGSFSTGCIVVNNEAAEDLFTLADDMHSTLPLIIAPCNLAKEKPDVDFRLQPAWLAALYRDLASAIAKMPI